MSLRYTIKREKSTYTRSRTGVHFHRAAFSDTSAHNKTSVWNGPRYNIPTQAPPSQLNHDISLVAEPAGADLIGSSSAVVPAPEISGPAHAVMQVSYLPGSRKDFLFHTSFGIRCAEPISTCFSPSVEHERTVTMSEPTDSAPSGANGSGNPPGTAEPVNAYVMAVRSGLHFPLSD